MIYVHNVAKHMKYWNCGCMSDSIRLLITGQRNSSVCDSTVTVSCMLISVDHINAIFTYLCPYKYTL